MNNWITGTALASSLVLLAFVSAVAQTGGANIKMVDCFKDSENVKCQRPDSTMSIGEGVTFNQGGVGEAIAGGFVLGNRAILAAKLSTGGAVVAVNLETGDRELISGRMNINESRGKALRFVGSPGGKEDSEAYKLDGINDVKPLPNGNFLAIGRRSYDRMELIEIDAKTGDRKLYWASELAPDTHAGGLQDTEKMDVTKRCPEKGVNNRNPNPTSYTVAVDASGSAYLQINNNPLGVGFGYVRIKNGKCEDLSTYDFDLNDIVGSGFKTPREEVNHMIVDGNTLYSVSYFADTGHLIAVNLETGDRKVISHKDSVASKSKGKGDIGIGTLGIALNAGGFWTIKEVGDGFKLIRVDPKTGERTLVPAKAGPLLKMRGALVQKVFAIPGSDLLMISMDTVLTVFDPKTGNSNSISI